MAEADCVLFAAILARSLSYAHATRDWYQVNLAHIPDEGIPLMPWSANRTFSRHILARARWYYLKTCISCENERIPTPFPSKSYVQAVPFRKGNKKHVPKGLQCVWR